MYTGSMMGIGSVVFAVWGYVIAYMRPDETVGAQVELNPALLAVQIGDTEPNIQAAIDKLCAPDERSRTKEEDGRRLIKLGEFDYRVVNGPKYLAIRNEEERREANRLRQQQHRAAAKLQNGAPKKRRKTLPPTPEQEAEHQALEVIRKYPHGVPAVHEPSDLTDKEEPS